MSRGVVVLLVFVLTGVPATAVLCDLVLCAAERTAATSCHDHGTPADADQVSSAAGNCSHLASIAPFVAAPQRATSDGDAVLDANDAFHRLTFAVSLVLPRAAHHRHAGIPASRYQPLRI
jgi:hypothetical protein